jgi:hypothetical protein
MFGVSGTIAEERCPPLAKPSVAIFRCLQWQICKFLDWQITHVDRQQKIVFRQKLER